ncbi:MAG: TetR/AcrR family transcriptional regulator [Planctomycetota bacterium]
MESAKTKGVRTRRRVLDAAARRVREEGLAGVAVHEVMRDAGLTHGGFYAHFENRERLLAEAVGHAGRESGDWLERRVGHLRGRAWVEAWVDGYLGDAHCRSRARGCILPALTPELARASEAVRRSFREVMERRYRRIVPKLPCPPDEARRRLRLAYAQMAGALMLARVSGPAVSRRLRRDAAASAKALLLGDGPGLPGGADGA